MCGSLDTLESAQLAIDSNFNALVKPINKLDKEITKRDLRDYDIIFVHLEIERSKYPLKKLKEYLCSRPKSSLNSQDASAYADSASEHILDLIKHAGNLDGEYMSTA